MKFSSLISAPTSNDYPSNQDYILLIKSDIYPCTALPASSVPII